MRSSEDLLKLIIAEAINGVLSEADEPEVIRRPTLRPQPQLSPAEVERVRQGIEPSTPPEVARTYTPSARLPGGLSEKLAGLAPTIGGLYDQFTSVIKDPVYVERQKIVDASRELQRESQKEHNDPVVLLTNKLREGVTLEADQPTSVSAVVIRDILLTQSVLNAIEKHESLTAKDLLKSAHVSGKILTTDAMKFALSIRAQYTRLARDKAAGLNYDRAAEEVLRDASQTIRDAVSEIGSAATISAGTIIETRLSTQAIALSPFMKTIEDGERKIRRTSGSTGPMAAGNEERTYRDSGTGNLTKSRILTSAPIGTGDVLTIPSEQISADEVNEFLPGQIQVFDQARVATFRLVNARGFYYVAQANVLLKMKDKIVEYYKKQNSKQTPKIEEAFDKLSSDLSKHPYGKTDVSDAKSAIEDLDSMPAVGLSDDNLSAARKAADILGGSDLSELRDLVDRQKSVSSVIIKGAIEEIVDNTDTWLANKIAASIGQLLRVLRAALKNVAESYRVQPAVGASQVLATKAPSDVSSTSSEGKVYLANENLKDAIDVFLQEPASKDSLGSFRSIVSLADEAVKQEDMGDSVAKILDEVTGDFGKNVNELKQEQAKLRSDVFAIIGSSESTKVGAIGRLALKQLETPSIEQNVKRRIKDARDARNEDTPANIFLTMPHAFEGAIQLAAELGGTSVDSFTRYAIPGFGSIAGNPKVNTPKGRSKQEHLEMLATSTARTDVYLKALGLLFNRNEKLIIPSMIKVNNHLSLGVGRLISNGVEQVVITERAIASLRAKMPDVAEKIGTGKSINVMHVTVQFPAGSWKIGHQPFETLEKDDIKRRINRLNVLSERVGQSSARNLSVSVKADLMNALPDNAYDVVDTNNLPEIQKAIRDVIDDLARERDAAKGRGYITKADVISAIKGGVTQDFLEENVSVDDDGNLTLSKIAPSFLDAAASHVFEIRSNRWDDAIPTLTSASNIVLRAKTFAPGRSQDKGLYLPADAIQLSASDREHPDNPFNINRQMINDGVRIDYKTSTAASTQQVNFSLKDLETGNTPDELRQKRLALCAAFEKSLADNNILESDVRPGTPRVRPGTPRDDGSEDRRYPIVVVVDQSQGEKADSAIKLSGNFNGYYFFDGQDLADGKYKLVYQMTDAALDPKSNIKRIKIGGSDIKVGSMVYIKAMYEAIGTSTSRGVANTPSPPEIYGIGRVMRIYLEGDETADENDKGFKTLLADVKFRGDQVKLRGKRGSIHSPEITLNRVGCMFLGAVTAGGGFFDPARAIDKDLERNYATIAPAILDTAGWRSPSAQDVKRNASTPVGGLRVGERYQIVQNGNPMEDAIGKLIGFLPSNQVSSDLDDALSRKGIELSAANALLDASGSDLLEGFQAELDWMIENLTGKTISDFAVKQIFRKIDDDITQDYVKSPTNASGYASHGTDSDVIGDMTHGAGAWEKMHEKGQAVHPGNEQFLSMSGRSKVEKVNFKSASGLNTLLGCSAILRAILKHGPERQSNAESAYNAERDVMNPGVVDVTRTATSSTPYPSGLHTHEAVYFKDKRGHMRVGSPVGTSFRFKLDNATGLAYTRVLRENMASLLVEVKSSIGILRSKIEEAEKSPIHPDSKVIAAAQKILDSLERDVMNPISNGIDEVSSLGYQEKDADGDVDTTKPVQNTLDAWHSVNRELESLKVKSTVSLENGSDVFKKIKGLYTKIEVEAGRLLGSAPIPTEADLSVNDEGEIVITLRAPKPVSDPAARNSWRSAQRSIVNNMTNTIMKQSVIFVDSNGVPVKAGANEDRIAAHLASSRSMKNIFDLHKNNLKGGNPLSWENDILAHPAMLEFIDQDGIRDAIRSPTGSKDQLPGIVTSNKKILLAKDNPNLGTVNVIYDEEYMNAYSACVESIQREKSSSTQGGTTLVDLLEDLVLTLKSLGKSGFDQLANQLEEFKRRLRSFIPGLGSRDIARQAAQAEQVLMSVVRSLSVLASTSSLTVVEPPPLVSSSADENVSGTYNNLRKKLRDISLKNERKALAEMTSFPADEGTASIIETMKSLRKAATSDSVQRAIVPIAKLSDAESSELNRLKMGEEIPASLGGLIGVSLRKITS